MATRQEIQIAQDLIRFVNIVNDLMDVTAYTLQDIDAQTGKHLQIQELIDSRTELPFLETATPEERAEFGVEINRDATFEELRDRTIRLGQNVGGYKVQIITFLDAVDQALVVSGLTALGVNALTLKTELLAMNDVRLYVATNLPTFTTKDSLAVLGQYIDTNIPKLTLVRRSWCLGA